MTARNAFQTRQQKIIEALPGRIGVNLGMADARSARITRHQAML
jgi:hypothetical protein